VGEKNVASVFLVEIVLVFNLKKNVAKFGARG